MCSKSSNYSDDNIIGIAEVWQNVGPVDSTDSTRFYIYQGQSVRAGGSCRCWEYSWATRPISLNPSRWNEHRPRRGSKPYHSGKASRMDFTLLARVLDENRSSQMMTRLMDAASVLISISLTLNVQKSMEGALTASSDGDRFPSFLAKMQPCGSSSSLAIKRALWLTSASTQRLQGTKEDSE
jgi:hypothetical protein